MHTPNMIITFVNPDKRLKQLMKEFGKNWLIIKYKTYVQGLRCSGYFVKSICGKHKRWVEADKINDI